MDGGGNDGGHSLSATKIFKVDLPACCVHRSLILRLSIQGQEVMAYFAVYIKVRNCWCRPLSPAEQISATSLTCFISETAYLPRM